MWQLYHKIFTLSLTLLVFCSISTHQFFKAFKLDHAADAIHQIQIKPQIMHGRESYRQRFSCCEQMAKIRPGMMQTAITITCIVNWGEIFFKLLVSDLNNIVPVWLC